MMTREEALNKVREMKLSPGKDAELIIALHTLIPELAESECERIRKYILKACKETIEADDRGLELSMDTTKKLYVCLEKLKEQPTNEEMLRTLRTEYEKGVADTIAKYEQKEQKSVDSVSREEYVKKFKVLCDAYEIKLPNREYDIYHLCDDLSKLFVNSDDAKLRGSDIEELEWLIEEYRTWEPDCSEHQLYELIASEFNRRHSED